MSDFMYVSLLSWCDSVPAGEEEAEVRGQPVEWAWNQESYRWADLQLSKYVALFVFIIS